MKQLTKTEQAVQEGRPLFINKVVKPEWGQLPIKGLTQYQARKAGHKGEGQGADHPNPNLA